MKKIFLAALATLSIASSVSAEKTTFKWDIPGTVAIVTDQISNDPVALASDQTEYTYEYDGSGYVWLYSVEGYAITSVIKGNDTKSLSSSKSQKAGYGSQISPFISSAYDGQTVVVTLEKVECDKSFTINVENGAQYINTSLYAIWKDDKNVSHGYTCSVPLQNGVNTVPFSSKYSSNFEFNLVKGGNADSVFSAKKNGEALNGGINYYFGPFALTETDVFDIRVFENEEVELKTCTLTFDIPSDIADCIKSIRDWRKNEFVTLNDNKLEVYENSDIQVNFNDDVTIEKIMLGDKDITGSFNETNRSVRFNVAQSTTFAITGYETVYGDVEFTAYVMNPEGVYITKEQYGGIRNIIADAAIDGGVAITSDIQMPESVISQKDGSTLNIKGAVMTPENTKVYKIKVSEKNPNFYVSAGNGYFIKAVWNSELTEPLPYASSDFGTTVYIVAQKIDNSSEAKVIVNGNEPLVFTASTAFSMMWDNRPSTFGLMQGEQIVKFDYEYDNPFSLRPSEELANFEAYLDGWKLGSDDNGVYQVNFDSDSSNMSTLVVYADGKTKGASGSVLVNAYDGMEATCYYSDLNKIAPVNTFSLLAGTPVSVEPKGNNFRMLMDNQLIYGYENGTLVNKLTDGKYTFTVTKNMIAVFDIEQDTEAPSAVVEIEAANAGDGKIFNIHGIYVGEDLDSLPAGVYVCNGKKLIKK